MKTKELESSQELREITDKSLEEERKKTDEHLEQQTQEIEERTSEKVRSIERASEEHGGSDKSQAVKRQEEASARTQESFQKELIAETEALLERERKSTDSNLLEERVHVDLELTTRDQFVAIVSHDLKNSVIAISIRARLMRKALSRNAPDAVSLLENLGIIEQAAAGMNRMINELLDVERMAHGKLALTTEKVDIHALIQESLDLFAPIISSKSFSIANHFPSEQIFAHIDHDRILQVLSNLIGNSLKFTPNGGTIELSVRTQGTEVEISVTDNGPGIPQQAMAQLFEKFSQLQLNDRRGLGLGLFIAKWIVEAHQGRIWVTSDVGKGSTFSFALPLH
ncbi:MAG: ATP-binding protein [Nitrospirota bacterium]